MRRRPPPLSVTRPPPSRTTRGPWSLRTLAVVVIVMVTGDGPQWNVMMPPAATAATTAADVQLAAVPVPITRVGCDVSTARAAAGTVAVPRGLPYRGRAAGGGVALGPALVWAGLVALGVVAVGPAPAPG